MLINANLRETPAILRKYFENKPIKENEEDNAISQFGDNTDTDSLPELHSVPMQPTSLKNREQNLPNDILLEAMKIAGNEKDLEN